MDNCPNCGKAIKNNIWDSNYLIKDCKLNIIKEIFEESAENYCIKCGEQVFLQAYNELKSRVKTYKEEIAGLIESIPISSIHSPMHWNYRTIGVVTAQSVTGTGVFSELSMSISDIFGSESKKMNTKIRDAELLCFRRLRESSVNMGGNAIVGLDIDYSEVGSLRGMMMVCCTGTAIDVTNLEDVNSELKDSVSRANDIQKKIEKYRKLNIEFQALP